jgi:hypothetical protein
MRDSFNPDIFQGRRKDQVDFSHKVVNISYYAIITGIVLFVVYEWLK